MAASQVEHRREQTITELLDHTKLRFPGDLEAEFRTDYLEKSLTIIRVGLMLGIILYSLFGVLDIFIAPLTRNLIWVIRFAIVSPALAITLALTWTRFYGRIMDASMSIVALLSGFGIIAMIAISRDANATMLYYAGLILVIMWTYTFTKLRFLTAVVVCWIIVLGYEFTGIFIQNMTADQESLVVLINNNFFFISANVLGMVVNLLMERYARKDFLRRLILERNQELLTAERNELYETNMVVKRELELARRIQQNMIPHDHPNDMIYAIYRPMEEVGGDFYDFINIPNSGKVGIFLSDVSGHGVSAAFITSMVKSIVSQSARYAENPAKLLGHLNSLLVNQIDDRFVTAFYGTIDLSERSFIYANAGHPPPFVCTTKGVVLIKTPNQHVPIGFIDNAEMAVRKCEYINYRVMLPEESKLVLYTDGLVEAMHEKDEDSYFSDIIEEKIIGLRKTNPREFVERLYASLVEFHGSEKFDDDICLICVSMTG